MSPLNFTLPSIMSTSVVRFCSPAVVQTDRLLIEGEIEAVLAVGREVLRELHRVARA